MDYYDSQMIPVDEHGLNFLTFILQLKKIPGKKLNQEIDPTGDRIRASCVRGNDVTPSPQRWSQTVRDQNLKRKFVRILDRDLNQGL